LLVLFLGYRDLPLIDLPQHVSQISTWIHWNDPMFRGQSMLEVNTRTPYVLVEYLARWLTPAIGTLNALKLLAWIGVVGNMLTISKLARKLGHDPAFALLGLLTALGYSFYFGFISFVFTTPLVLVCVLAGIAHAEKPDLRRGALLTALLFALLVAHGFAFAIAVATVGLTLTIDRAVHFRREPGRVLRRFAPLLIAVTVAAIWIGRDHTLHKPIAATVLDIGLQRVFGLPALILGVGGSPDYLAIAFACGVMLACEIGLYQRNAKGSVPKARYALLAVSIAGYLLLPLQLPSTGCLHERLVPFLLPGLMLAIPPVREQDRPRRLALFRGLCLVLTVGWVAVLGLRLSSLNRETADFHAMEQLMPPEQRIRPLIFDSAPKAFPGNPAFLHFPAYFVAEHGGTVAYSLAVFPHMVIRYRAGVTPPLEFGREWEPKQFDAARELSSFDYVLVHAGRDPASLFAKAPSVVTPDAHVGKWWGYRVTHAATARAAL